MKVEYHPAVEYELKDAIKYYNDCATGLGSEFLNEFERQVLIIAANPFLWTEIEKGFVGYYCEGFRMSFIFEL